MCIKEVDSKFNLLQEAVFCMIQFFSEISETTKWLRISGLSRSS